MKREDNLETLEAVIRRFLRQHGLEEKYMERRLIQAWEEILGSVIARKTADIYVKKRVLHVKLESAVIREELNYAREKLVNTLNEAVGYEMIESIELR